MGFIRDLTTTRVLFLSAERVVASLRWNKALSVVSLFKGDEEGYEAFSRYLDTPPHAPIYIVADLNEEDFRHEKVPHVRGADRKALLDRRLAQFFHSTPYRFAAMQGRESSGRRDDRVLLSALTHDERLEPWIQRILAVKAPLAGISSSPLLSEFLAVRMFQESGPHLLLVSHQRHSGLRQTYLRKGYLKLSRLTPFVQAPDPGLTDPLPEVLVEECRRTRQYLERQRHIGYDEILDVHVCAEPEDCGRLAHVDGTSPPLRIHVHDMDALARSFGVEAADSDPGVFSSFLVQVRRSPWLPNHYAPASMLRYQHIRQLRLGIMFLAFVVLLLSCWASFPLVLSGLNNFSRQQSLRKDVLVLTNTYQGLRRNFPEVPVSAEVMRDTVDTVNRLRLLPSPLGTAIHISRILDQFPEVRVHRFAWETRIKTAGEENPLIRKTPGALISETEPPHQAELLAAMIEGNTQVVILIAGNIYPFEGQRAAHHSLNRFAAALETIPGIRASLIEVPLEIRSDATTKTRLGAEGNENAFLLRIDKAGP